MERSDINLLVQLKRSLWQKGNKIKKLSLKVQDLEEQIRILKECEWKCTFLEKENVMLRMQNGRLENPELSSVENEAETQVHEHGDGQVCRERMDADVQSCETMLSESISNDISEILVKEEIPDSFLDPMPGTPVSSASFSDMNKSPGSHCPFCSKYCGGPAEIRRHLPIHTGEKPYSCPSCPYRAAYKSAVTRHYKYRHTRDRILCPHCSKPFVERHALKLHVRAQHRNLPNPSDDTIGVAEDQSEGDSSTLSIGNGTTGTGTMVDHSHKQINSTVVHIHSTNNHINGGVTQKYSAAASNGTEGNTGTGKTQEVSSVCNGTDGRTRRADP